MKLMQICYVIYLSATIHSNNYANLVQDHGPRLHDPDLHELDVYLDVELYIDMPL